MTDGKLSNVLKAKEDLLKSPEQLEQEKREILKSRLMNLRLDGASRSDLIDQARKFHEHLLNLHSQIYDMTEKQDSQKYIMMELAERARQMEKGNIKNRKSTIVHTGLGGSVRYERVTDRRTFKDRREHFLKEHVVKKEVKEIPKAKLKELKEPKQRRNRRAELEAEDAEEQKKAKEEEAIEEEPAQEEEPAENEGGEEQANEDAPAEEEPAEEE